MRIKYKLIVIAAAMLVTVFPLAFGLGGQETAVMGSPEMESPEDAVLQIRGPLPDWQKMYSPEMVDTAVFAGGCFWGVEAVFEQLDGVLDVDSGYSGGEADTAHYKLVGTGATGHAEAVEIVFDPEKISYTKLLEVFFRVAHDPTQFNYQGPDQGTEYRSAVFYKDQQQKKLTEEMINSLENEGLYKDNIVTEITPLDAFYPAEDYHQDFLRLNPTYPYIVYWDMPKLLDLQEKYPELISGEE